MQRGQFRFAHENNGLRLRIQSANLLFRDVLVERERQRERERERVF